MAYPVTKFPGAVVVLLITGVAALVFGVFLFLDYSKNKKKTFHALWALSFFILFAAGLLLVLFNDYDLLTSPGVSVLGALLPGGIAAGLFYARSNKLGRIYLLYVVVMTVIIGLTKFIPSLDGFSSAAVMILHIPSGLSMVFLPLLEFKNEGWPAILASAGGLVMSVAGVMMAFLVTGSEVFPKEFIFMLLPWVLLIVAVCLALGFLYTKKYSFKVPILNP